MSTESDVNQTTRRGLHIVPAWLLAETAKCGSLQQNKQTRSVDLSKRSTTSEIIERSAKRKEVELFYIDTVIF